MGSKNASAVAPPTAKVSTRECSVSGCITKIPVLSVMCDTHLDGLTSHVKANLSAALWRLRRVHNPQNEKLYRKAFDDALRDLGRGPSRDF